MPSDDRGATHYNHGPTRQLLGWYPFSIMLSGYDECHNDQMIAKGVYGRLTIVGRPAPE